MMTPAVTIKQRRRFGVTDYEGYCGGQWLQGVAASVDRSDIARVACRVQLIQISPTDDQVDDFWSWSRRNCVDVTLDERLVLIIHDRLGHASDSSIGHIGSDHTIF